MRARRLCPASRIPSAALSKLGPRPSLRRSIIPRMPVMGVRRSWLMAARKADLAWLAISAVAGPPRVNLQVLLLVVPEHGLSPPVSSTARPTRSSSLPSPAAVWTSTVMRASSSGASWRTDQRVVAGAGIAEQVGEAGVEAGAGDSDHGRHLLVAPGSCPCRGQDDRSAAELDHPAEAGARPLQLPGQSAVLPLQPQKLAHRQPTPGPARTFRRARTR